MCPPKILKLSSIMILWMLLLWISNLKSIGCVAGMDVDVTYTYPEDDSTPARVVMRWPQPSMCPVPPSTCTLHATLCTKCDFLPFWNRIFTIKMGGESRFNLTDGYLWLWSFIPSSQKWIRLSKLPSYFSFKTPSFPQFSMAVACCYNGWNLNTSILCNAQRIGLETSSDFTTNRYILLQSHTISLSMWNTDFNCRICYP